MEKEKKVYSVSYARQVDDTVVLIEVTTEASDELDAISFADRILGHLYSSDKFRDDCSVCELKEAK